MRIRGLVLGAAVLALGVALVFGCRLVAPLREFERRAREVASGGYVHPMTVDRADELGMLAEAFNDMGVRLNSLQDMSQLLASVKAFAEKGAVSGVFWRAGAVVTVAHALPRASDISVVLPDGSTTKAGWTLGAGVEGAIPNTSAWTWKAEYLYIDFGTVSGNSVQIGFEGARFPYSWSTRVTDNIVRVGFNYRWGGGAY